ncbi:hypothetical protein P171DRAFT_488431 [Karstenula rhodostoma CBS 690.94]|uniref:IBR domain-containing protein n=1 Tax=Karstenula rhodostoma CBS 690.94 TaxID=1392251 RepID=A0A9P4U8G4_9PLEO|nr:hypothetical protein P171DRAFT_488431 [Karstenula rhodostoma CBS 690.94]
MEYMKVAKEWATAVMWSNTPHEAQNWKHGRSPGLQAQNEAMEQVNEHDDEDTSQALPGKARNRAKCKRAKKKAEAAAKEKAEAAARSQMIVFEKANPECSTCAQRFPADTYPRIEGCAHEPETYEECLEGRVDSQLDNTIVEDGIRCPSTCDRKLSLADLKGKISRNLYEKFDNAITRAALRKLPNYRDCMAQGCKSGQFHDSKTDGNIFRCNECGFRLCTVHEVPFHDGETCNACDEHKKVIPEHEEASKQAIARFSKPFPACGPSSEPMVFLRASTLGETLTRQFGPALDRSERVKEQNDEEIPESEFEF